MQISPLQNLPVAYETSIPGDTTLYYVQAVLRDTALSTVLQTLNLKNVSSTPNRYVGQFSGSNLTDASGLGHAVDVTISVYTDSGYSSLSPNYQILQTSYVVLQPWINNLGMGGGLNIDYDKLQKMFDGTKINNNEIGNEVAKKVPRTQVDYDRVNESVLGASEGIRAALSGELQGHVETISKMLLDASKGSNEANTAHGARLQALESRIQGLERGMRESTTLSSKERSAMKNELISVLKEIREESKKSNESTSKESDKRLKKAVEDIQNYLGDNLSEKEIKMVYSMAPQKRGKEEKNNYSADEYLRLLR